MSEDKYSPYFKTNKKGKKVSLMQSVLRPITVPFIRLIFPFKFYGNTKMPDGAVLFVGNHYRVFDIIYPGTLTREGVHFLAKSSLVKHKILGPFCRACKVIPVNRDGYDVRGVITALKCLKNGEKVSIYPEGTRNKTDNEILPFFGGASMFAIKAKVPIIPITLYEKQRPFRLAHVIVGESFEFSEYYGMKLTEDVIKEADEKLKNVILNQRYEHKKMLEEKSKKRKNKCK